MAEAKKSGGSSSSKGEEAREGFPRSVPRGGARVHHDRILTGAERREREAKRQKVQKERAAKQQSERKARNPKGWAGRRRER